MSVFILSTDHICTFSLWAEENSRLDSDKLVKDISNGNALSFQTRYPNDIDCQGDAWRELITNEAVNALDKVRESEYHKKLVLAEIYGMAKCVDYQCNEMPDYDKSELHEDIEYVLSEIIRQQITTIIKELNKIPGYKPVEYYFDADEHELEKRGPLPDLKMIEVDKEISLVKDSSSDNKKDIAINQYSR